MSADAMGWMRYYTCPVKTYLPAYGAGFAVMAWKLAEWRSGHEPKEKWPRDRVKHQRDFRMFSDFCNDCQYYAIIDRVARGETP